MAMIDNETISKIREKSDIVDVISSYIALYPRGKNYFGVCPFHDDNHPSMSVSKEKQIYKCFSCGATGNVFKFVQDYENISFLEAVKLLANKAGIPLQIGTTSKKENKNQSLLSIYDLACKFYQNNLYTAYGKEARLYLEKRNISETVMKEFQIGLSLDQNTYLSKLLLGKKIASKDLDKSGLVFQKNGTYFDLYYSRIMFPLYDLEGNVVGFSGRIYKTKDDSKYINTRETDIFKKGELLYNYHRAKNVARQKGQIIIMEGFMDVIRAYTIGIENVIATMGTAVTKKQALLIKRMAKEVLLCFDGDEAGAKASLSCSDELLKIGIQPKIVRLEDNLDPDEFIQTKGADRFFDYLNHPMDVMEFRASYYKKNKDLNSVEQTANYVNQMLEDLTDVTDEVLKELTLQKLSREVSLDVEILRKKLQEKEKISLPKVEKESKIEKKNFNRFEKAEAYLVYYMLDHKLPVKLYMEKHPFINQESYRKLANYIVQFYKEHEYIRLSDLMTSLYEKEDMTKTIQELLFLNLKEEFTEQEIEDYIKQIQEYNIQVEIKRLQKKMKEETLPMEKAKIMEQIIVLKKEDNQL